MNKDIQHDEHDDDLESTVHEEAELESAGFPDTGDELDDEFPAAADDTEELHLDEDETEL